MDLVSRFRLGQRPGGDAQVMQDAAFGSGGNCMHGIEPQSIEAIVTQPVNRILNRERAHLWP